MTYIVSKARVWSTECFSVPKYISLDYNTCKDAHLTTYISWHFCNYDKKKLFIHLFVYFSHLHLETFIRMFLDIFENAYIKKLN